MLQAMSLFRDAAEYIRWLRAIRVPVLVAAGDKDSLTPLVCVCPWDSASLQSSRFLHACSCAACHDDPLHCM